ncbi:hypothetical protein QY95_02063 [Bacillus thermotolerans]|uniref:Uncharacterized protein n=1 Tax=Bacillus thermotolerans TaxID=1221996 RepID=A0A0F5I2T6_BACTR|nr:hypothetical protein QY95_02063 [Bacillus thermotolerans]
MLIRYRAIELLLISNFLPVIVVSSAGSFKEQQKFAKKTNIHDKIM